MLSRCGKGWMAGRGLPARWRGCVCADESECRGWLRGALVVYICGGTEWMSDDFDATEHGSRFSGESGMCCTLVR